MRKISGHSYVQSQWFQMLNCASYFKYYLKETHQSFIWNRPLGSSQWKPVCHLQALTNLVIKAGNPPCPRCHLWNNTERPFILVSTWPLALMKWELKSRLVGQNDELMWALWGLLWKKKNLSYPSCMVKGSVQITGEQKQYKRVLRVNVYESVLDLHADTLKSEAV